jgi:hypothetical protein
VPSDVAGAKGKETTTKDDDDEGRRSGDRPVTTSPEKPREGEDKHCQIEIENDSCLAAERQQFGGIVALLQVE